MILCPIAKWKALQPEKNAFDDLTYEQLDLLIQALTYLLAQVEKPFLAFSPKSRPIDVAFFFAAWRLGKAVYPLSFRLPKQAIQDRLEKTGAAWVDLDQVSLGNLLPKIHLEEENLATLIETSGSSGFPKIVCHRLSSHFLSADYAIDALEIDSDSIYALNLPLFHISGLALCLRTLLAGATLTTNIQSATHLSMVPTQLFRFLESGDSLPALKCLLMGGAPLPPRLLQQALERGLPIYTSYGMTETGSMISINGMALGHVGIKIGSEGEIFVSGPSLFENYFGEGPSEEWFATKDLGRVSAEGKLEILGRKDRQFISGGENIQPEEIERAFLQLEGILQAKVIAEENEEFGMVPTAILYGLMLEGVEEKLEAFLPRFKIPKKIVWSDQPLASKLAEQLQDLSRNRH